MISRQKFGFLFWLRIVSDIGARAVFEPFRVCKSCVIVVRVGVFAGRFLPKPRSAPDKYPPTSRGEDRLGHVRVWSSIFVPFSCGGQAATVESSPFIVTNRLFESL